VKRVFLDANVLFTAAHNPRGKAALLFDLADLSCWSLITCRLACEEARRNLVIKFPACLERLEDLLQSIATVPMAGGVSCALELPDKDKPIFLAAVYGRATHLLTGDKAHFGPFMNKATETQGIVIQTVSEFLFAALNEAEDQRKE